MTDILVLSQQDIHDLASGKEISVPRHDGKGKFLIMSRMRYLTNHAPLTTKRSSVDRCVLCGREVPEGRHVCPICEFNITKKK